MAAAGAFLESALVHGNYYGTSQHWINDQRAAGADILLEIDWQGAAQVRKVIPEAVGIFIIPPSLETLAERLSARATDTPAVIERRLRAARDEISHLSEFDYVIINKGFDTAARDLQCVVSCHRLRLAAQLQRHLALINRLK